VGGDKRQEVELGAWLDHQSLSPLFWQVRRVCCRQRREKGPHGGACPHPHYLAWALVFLAGGWARWVERPREPSVSLSDWLGFLCDCHL
jgi:hypothetical protein